MVLVNKKINIKKVEKFKKRFILWDLLPSVESVDGGW